MSMTALEKDTIAKMCANAKRLLLELLPQLEGLNEIYNSAGGVASTLTQEDLDAEAALSGLTKQQADDSAYALTAVVLPAIRNSYANLAQVAARTL